jgi:hypothetical protein
MARMRDLGIGKLAAVRTQDGVPDGGDYFAPDRENEHANEVFQVLREIGIHLAAFLSIALAVNVLLVLFGAVPA